MKIRTLAVLGLVWSVMAAMPVSGADDGSSDIDIIRYEVGSGCAYSTVAGAVQAALADEEDRRQQCLEKGLDPDAEVPSYEILACSGASMGGDLHAPALNLSILAKDATADGAAEAKSTPVVLDGSVVLESGGHLTIGGESSDASLVLNGTISVTNGTLTTLDGLTMEGSGPLVNLSGEAAHASFEGGSFTAFNETVLASGAVIDKISGGTYTKTDTEDTRAAFYADHETVVDEISGGTFSAAEGSGFALLRGSVIHKISGGTFRAESENERNGLSSHGLYVTGGVSTDTWSQEIRTGIDLITGGEFLARGKEQSYGLYLCNATVGNTYIDTITGGTFYGASGLFMANMHSRGEVTIHEITDGIFWTNGEDEYLYLDGGFANYGGIVDEISGGFFYSERQYAPAILQFRFCFIDEDAEELYGHGGIIHKISDCTAISSGDEAAERNWEECIVDDFAGGVYYGNSAVRHDSAIDFKVTGGYFRSFTPYVIEIFRGQRARLTVEPGLTDELDENGNSIEFGHGRYVSDEYEKLYDEWYKGYLEWLELEPPKDPYPLLSVAEFTDVPEEVLRRITFRTDSTSQVTWPGVKRYYDKIGTLLTEESYDIPLRKTASEEDVKATAAPDMEEGQTPEIKVGDDIEALEIAEGLDPELFDEAVSIDGVQELPYSQDWWDGCGFHYLKRAEEAQTGR